MRRDDYYLNLCVKPSQYDMVIDWISTSDPSAIRLRDLDKAESYAINIVHECIRGVIQGDSSHVSTGMCIAVRLSNQQGSWNNPNPDYKKVILGIVL